MTLIAFRVTNKHNRLYIQIYENLILCLKDKYYILITHNFILIHIQVCANIYLTHIRKYKYFKVYNYTWNMTDVRKNNS